MRLRSTQSDAAQNANGGSEISPPLVEAIQVESGGERIEPYTHSVNRARRSEQGLIVADGLCDEGTSVDVAAGLDGVGVGVDANTAEIGSHALLKEAARIIV